MESFILENEAAIRLAAFVGIFAAVALGEWRAPRRRLTVSKWVRWSNNLAVVALNTLLVRLVFSVAAVGLAATAAARGWGFFNIVALPQWLAVAASVVVLDFIIYLQHVMFHAVPALWRLHLMHHADLDIDVTTGARFHPVEILGSMVIKMAAVLAIGPPVVAVVVFEVVLNGTAMFNHGNLRLPLGLDRLLRWVVVTPDMHRVHHSVRPEETNSNFGFNLTWWDRLFGTYRDQPVDGHEAMTIGLGHLRKPAQQYLWNMLALPVRAALGNYPLNRRLGEESGPDPPPPA